MLSLHNVSHTYGIGKDVECRVLADVNIAISLNSFVVLLGQSGSGKTTLLNIIAGLLRPTQGVIRYDGYDIYKLDDKKLSMYRRDNIGFVFQSYFLDNNFSAIDNVRVPLFLRKGMTSQQQLDKAKDALCQVGLQDKLHNKPTQLSGGQCQRIAIARALVNRPTFIMADEPTGNLDSTNGEAIVQLLRAQVSDARSVIMVTHNDRYIKSSDIVYKIDDEQIQGI